MRASLALALSCCLLAAACSRVSDEADQAPRRPNILLISLDSTRRDRLGCYGGRPKFAPELSPSPHLDALAARGCKLEEALAPTSWTLPSHISLLTGEPLLVHGVEIDESRLGPEPPTLAGVLKQQGYRTAGFVSGPYLDASFGFDRGFDVYRTCYGPELAAVANERAALVEAQTKAQTQAGVQADVQAQTQAQTPAQAQEPADAEGIAAAIGAAGRRIDELSHRDVSSAAVTDAALEEIRADAGPGQPWFVFAHYFDPHYDYVPPAPFDTRFDPDYRGTLDGTNVPRNRAISVPDPARPMGRTQTCSQRDLDHLLALYDGDIAWTDEQIGRLLDGLGDAAANTLVIVTADHGDEFFEHGGLGHKRNLCEEVLRVPLIVAWPGVLPEGRSVPGLVSNTDVLPTLLELLDIAPPRPTLGASFASLLQGRADAAPRAVMARLVAFQEGAVALDPAQPDDKRKLLTAYVDDAFYSGTLKLLRERHWLDSGSGLSPEQQAQLERTGQQQRAEERVVWQDLGSERLERDAASSPDFSDAHAAAALQDFRRAYSEAVARRVAAPGAIKDDALSSQLGALGYLQHDSARAAGDGAAAGDRYVLPPPAARPAAPSAAPPEVPQEAPPQAQPAADR